MYPLSVVLWAFVAGTLAAGAVVWLLMTVGQLRARIVELEQAAKQPAPTATPQWAESMKLDHRAQLLSIAGLVKLGVTDNLDALMRISPEMAREVVERVAPQLFTKEIK